MSKGIQVAIDGPASAGKSTVAKLVAKRFGYVYCDTGAMYRSVTLAALRRGTDLTDEDQIIKVANEIKITFAPGNPQKVFIDGQEVTQAIRETTVAKNVSAVAAIPGVRSRMVELQRQIAQEGGIVMDGRDIGTTVLPDAPVKVFMVASAHERARRRFLDNQERGIDGGTIEELQRAIELRDQKDSTRAVSPLTQAVDAHLLDTTHLTIDQVVDQIATLIEKTQQQKQ
ncbi:(d)CMP kinase [Limosilactobacillus gorillae]|jgi:CMP/dCMP kinase|uniref:(d)CMP kinase n=1 Tax=Limosilactobacillus gorillae TaxID=1450649 RepID=UPI000A532E12|nr:(d)CMP kinase [Limosilactobacillus gorillae]